MCMKLEMWGPLIGSLTSKSNQTLEFLKFCIYRPCLLDIVGMVLRQNIA